MPQKPAWYAKIPDLIRQLEVFPRPFVDRPTIEFLFGVGRRRAQQIMAPCVTQQVGANGLADTALLIEHLRRIAAGQAGYYESRRRHKLARILTALHQERLRNPPLLVEAPPQVAAQEFENLPSGVHLAPGRITVDFSGPREALEKLLALAMAIGNDFERFERQVRPPS